MNNPWYDKINAAPMTQNQPSYYAPQQPQNPMQMYGQIMQAMRNPSQFVKNRFPDIPDDIVNDPDRILAYLKQYKGLTDQDIQQAQNLMPRL